MKNYSCENCGWQGDHPQFEYDEFGDGLPVCPKGCLDEIDNQPKVVQIDPISPLGAKIWARILKGK